MSITVRGKPIEGTDQGDLVLATHGAASALFQDTGEQVYGSNTDIWEAWKRPGSSQRWQRCCFSRQAW